MSPPALTLPFSAIRAADLPQVGGKGANLGEMAGAGFPVPPGFCLTTTAFRRFMAACAHNASLYRQLDTVTPDHLDHARQVGQMVRHTLANVTVPPEVATAVAIAYQQHIPQDGAVAVRSSATAEDLPDASFAGQQDTILNVCGADALLAAVRTCWISLFTDRAILYRARHGFDHRSVALSVVVQQMVLPDVSGILFTADPVSGSRHLAAIDASYGLGEALVAGLVTADLYQVDKRTQQVVNVQVGDKEVAIRPLPHGGTSRETITGSARKARVLNDKQAIDLARIGAKIEDHYGQPQDIEWAIVGEDIFILQSRPITSLFPIPPQAAAANTLQAMFSFAAVQGVLDPITPLGYAALRSLFASGAGVFGYDVTADTQRVIWQAGGRLWVNVTAMLCHPIGQRLLGKAFNVIEPGAAQAVAAILHEPDFQPQPGWFRWQTVRRLTQGFAPVVGRFRRIMRRPEIYRDLYLLEVEAYASRMAQRMAAAQTPVARLDVFEEMLDEGFGVVMPWLLPVIAGGLASLNWLLFLHRFLPAGAPSPLLLTRGLPHNPTTEMDLLLWQTAQRIRDDAPSAAKFAEADARELADLYRRGELPDAAQTAVSRFLTRFGMRGLAEIDLGRPRWREQPQSIMQTLQSYLHITGAERAPDAVFRRSAREAEQAAASLAKAARRGPGGRLKARFVAALAQRVRLLAGYREMPKFVIIRLFGVGRAALLQIGQELAQQDILVQADDIAFLDFAELRALINSERRNWQALVSERRAAYRREQKRTQIPRLLLSDGRAFYDGVRQTEQTAQIDEKTLVGSPVSPGLVEGVVHVVFNPHDAQLAPGEILVCPGTDPAWTPLFLAAGGLVMEVGGLMTHGSVVAREYGIPAVVGVHEATRRLQSGQHIRVDGSAGTVEILSERPQIKS